MPERGEQRHALAQMNHRDYSSSNAEHVRHNLIDCALKDEKTISDYLDHLYERFDGIKHVWDNNSYRANLNLIEYIKENNVLVLFMLRKNLFDAVLSKWLTGKANISQLSIEGNEDQSILKVKSEFASRVSHKCKIIPVGPLFSEATRSSYSLKYFWDELKAHEPKLIYYEDFYYAGDRTENLKEVCDFVGVDFNALDREIINARLLNKNVKQTTKDVLAGIENYETFLEIVEAHPGLANFTL